MQLWQTTGIVFFVYVVLVVAVRGPRGRAARRVIGGSACGLMTLVGSVLTRDFPLFQDWIWPPLTLLIAYWSSGPLFIAPVPTQEQALASLDERASMLNLARRTPRIVAELLEASYVGIYPLVLVALMLHLGLSPNPDASHFWSVILVTDYVCFGFLPWVQTRPPRALEPGEPWTSSIRRFNLRLLGAASIQVNTFPSGHAAEALAAGLLVLDTPTSVAGPMFIGALAVSAGAVLGRYHYLADVLAGWVVAGLVWFSLSG
jgi:membrane-associated phospholipid phosphatase